MRIFITLIALVVTLVSCNPNPQVVYTQQVPIVQQPVAVQQQYVPSNQNYQVITDPYSGAQQVVYSMNGLQYVIAYATFMNWYNYGGYGYVNSMYRSSPSYFGSYNYNRYRGWRSSSFRDTYRGPSRTYSSSPMRTTTTTSSTNRINSSGSSFGTPRTRTTTGSSFGSRSSTISRPSSSSFGSRSSSSSSSRSSFGRRGH